MLRKNLRCCDGKRIRALREQHRMSREQLAEEIGVEAMTIWRWEKGKTDPSLYFAQELSIVLGCSIDYLVGTNKK